jgi:class 3 adenylate cyclase/CHASE2 domain-containing sensor protein
MELHASREHRCRVQAFQRKHHTGVVTLVFTDVVGSTQLKQDLGDLTAIHLLERHQEAVRELLGRFGDAEEIDTAGDSFFLVFVRPSDAVKFSLLLQARLRELAAETGHPVFDRIGIHVGEVVIDEREDSGKDLYGIQVDTCARISGLGQSKQILMGRFAFDNARQVLKGQELEGIGALSWLNHGPYLFKGIEEPSDICEVGELGVAPLAAPADSHNARRCILADGESVLGWRPALGQAVPSTKWILEQKLGEGGFGEVWLGCHETLKERRVFKFCFRADRVRSLKREVTLFRLLRERVGRHPNIVGVQDVNFEMPPYYIVMDYAQGADLPTWCREHRGAANIPLSARLEIVAQVADALQAAHDGGVIHRDIKPSNILVSEVSDPRPSAAWAGLTARLTDFGIGQVVSQEVLGSLTRLGFTDTVGVTGSPRTGTYLYMAPELLAGKPASTRSDIYSLGVVLYQLVTADFDRPVTTDWASQVSDPLLKEDLTKCFAGDPKERFASASDLARSLRALPERRLALERRETEATERRKAAFRRVAALISVGVVLLMCLLRWLGIGPFERWEWITYDLRVREALHFKPAVATNLGFVYFDEQSVRAVADGSLGYSFGRYWPRQVYGRLVGELAAQKAKAVALDVFFGETWPEQPLVTMADGSFMESDEFFAFEVRRASNVIVAVTQDQTPSAFFRTNAAAEGEITLTKDPDGILRRVQVFGVYTNWHPAFRHAQDEYGVVLSQALIQSGQVILARSPGPGSLEQAIKVPLDKDGNFDLADFLGDKIPPGVARKTKPFTLQPVWHMGVVLAALELKLDLAQAEVNLAHGRVRLRAPGGLERVIPVDGEGCTYIDWSLPPDHPQLTREPFHSVLNQARIRREKRTAELTNHWSGKLVVVGSSAQKSELVDIGATPLNKVTPIATAHWNLANMIITDRFIHRSPLALELALIVLFGTIAAAMMWRIRPLLALPTLAFIAIAYIGISIVIYVRNRYWVPVVSPLLAMTVLFSCLAVWRMFQEQGRVSNRLRHNQ